MMIDMYVMQTPSLPGAKGIDQREAQYELKKYGLEVTTNDFEQVLLHNKLRTSDPGPRTY